VLTSEFRRKLVSKVLKDEEGKRYRIILKVKNKSHSKGTDQLKKDINPTDNKVGIKNFKTRREGRILIEICSEEVLNSFSRTINTKCGE